MAGSVELRTQGGSWAPSSEEQGAKSPGGQPGSWEGGAQAFSPPHCPSEVSGSALSEDAHHEQKGVL